MSQPNDGQDRMDYRETSDITEVHASIAREYAEPKTETMPIPTWLGVLSAGALCWAGAYIGAFHGGFSSKIYNDYESNPAALFPLQNGKGGAETATELPLVQLGEKVFAKNCAVCHGANGAGGNGNPPIAGSEWVDGAEYGEKRLIALLLKGISGPITVKGGTYNGNMPAWETLKPREIAAVATYIRQAFGNKGTGEFTEDQVKAARKLIADKVGAFSEAELKGIPTADKLDGGAASSVSAQPAVSEAKTGIDQKPPMVSSVGTYDLAASIDRGKAIYPATCGSCHQVTGVGVPGAFPPLIGVDYVTGDARRLVAITLKGITGPIKVKDMVYATGMPSPELTFPQMKDDKNVADVLNYVRNSWGNKAEVISPEFVGKVREEFKAKTDQWTEADLLNFPAVK